MSYKFTQKVSGSECGANAELSIIGAFSLIQDAVTDLMGSLNIDGITAQKKYGAMWVFSKNKIVFKKDAFWNDELFIESYISNISMIRLNIDTIVKNKDNEIVLMAKTEICGIDLQTKKIRKVETIGVTQSMLENIFETNISFSKNNISANNLVFSDKVKSSNIDFCHHTNNVEYIRFVVNSYSVKELYDKKIREFEINYINQSFEGDRLDVYREQVGTTDYIEVKNGENITTKCELVFNN